LDKKIDGETSLAASSELLSGHRVVRVNVRGASFGIATPPASAPMKTTGSAEGPRREAAERSSLWRSMLHAESAVAAAHQTFLRVAYQSADLIAKHTAYELDLIRKYTRQAAATGVADLSPRDFLEPSVAFDRRACLLFATGSATVLGPEYAAADSFPT